jgi:DNA-binding NarL/FixJ family response regulator
MDSPAPSPARLLLVDDHAIVRQGIAALLGREPDLAICGEAGTYEEGVALVRSAAPDAVVLDLSLRDRSGLDLIREVRAAGFSAPIVVLSMHDEGLYAEKAFRAGAQAYVMKDRADEDLLEAIRTVLAGERYLPPDLAATLASGESPPAPQDGYGLTARESEILLALGEGLSTKTIAERFGLSARTVDVHRANIRRKLGVATLPELIAKAVEYHRRLSGLPPADAR